jgi:hypothetical protein
MEVTVSQTLFNGTHTSWCYSFSVLGVIFLLLIWHPEVSTIPKKLMKKDIS